jgi:hypothetical protein
MTLIGRGGDPTARFGWMSEELLRDRFIAAGALTVADFDARDRAYADPSFWFAGLTFFGAWGRCPG